MIYNKLIRFVFLLCCMVVVCSCGRTPKPVSTDDATEEDSVAECTYTAQSGDSVTPAEIKEDAPFCFLGEAENREENFDQCPVTVMLDNVRELYRKYEVAEVVGTDLYRVCPYQLYTNSKYFTRLLKFKDNQQVAAVTFYGWDIPYIFKQGKHYMIALNSLASPVGYNTSTFTCKTLLLDESLRIIWEREFRYKEQKDAYYAYCYIDTLIRQPNGYDFRVINTGFDSEDYYEYSGRLSLENKVLFLAKSIFSANHSSIG